MKKIILYLLIVFTFTTFSNELSNYFPKEYIPEQVKKLEVSDIDRQISEKMEDFLVKTYRESNYKDRELIKLWDVAGKIVYYLGLQYDEIRLRVLEDPKLFVLSLPDGNIFISRGLLNFCQNDDELAFIIGREIYFIKNELSLTLREDRKIRLFLRENEPVIKRFFVAVNSINHLKADHEAAFYNFKTGHSPWNALNLLKRLAEVPEEEIEFMILKDINKRINSLEKFIKTQMPFSHIVVENVSNYKNLYYYFVLGNKFLKAGLLDDAISAYKESISINPRVAETHNNIGIAYSRKGFYNQALYHYKIAQELDKDYRYFFNSAVAAIKLGKYSEAHKYLKNSISRNRNWEKSQRLFLNLESFMKEMEKYEN